MSVTTKKTPVDKVYKLTGNKTPLSFTLASRSTRRFPLLYFDEEKNVNRSLRYASNQKSPFQDEQDNDPILEPVIFEKGMLFVPKSNPVLQDFLYYHPHNGRVFVEVNNEKDAAAEVEKVNMEADALIAARELTINNLETMYRVLFGRDPGQFTTAEIKRDVMVYAKRSPKEFMHVLNDPHLSLQASVHRFFEAKLLVFRNNRKEVFFNTDSNKKKMCGIPSGEDPYVHVSNFLKTDDGIEVLKVLERLLEGEE
jgi:hypothetical protein